MAFERSTLRESECGVNAMQERSSSITRWIFLTTMGASCFTLISVGMVTTWSLCEWEPPETQMADLSHRVLRSAEGTSLRSNKMYDAIDALIAKQAEHEQETFQFIMRRPINPDLNLKKPSKVQSATTKTTPSHITWLLSYPDNGERSVLEFITNDSYLNPTHGARSTSTRRRRRSENRVALTHIDKKANDQAGNIGWEVDPLNVLVETHCTGKCRSDDECRSIDNGTQSFLTGCLLDQKVVSLWTNKGVTKPVVDAVPEMSVFAGNVIHQIRHPLDTIVSRFHQEYNNRVRIGDRAFLKSFPLSQGGFHRWCTGDDPKMQNGIRGSESPDRKLSTAIPCQNEFFRYVQWHNVALAATQGLHIPVMAVRVEDLSDDSTDSRTRRERVLDILNLRGKHVAQARIMHTAEYADYFNAQERNSIRTYLHDFATIETWSQIRDYRFS